MAGLISCTPLGAALYRSSFLVDAARDDIVVHAGQVAAFAGVMHWRGPAAQACCEDLSTVLSLARRCTTSLTELSAAVRRAAG